MIEYPKIETLWTRDEKTRRVIPGQHRREDFQAVKWWSVTEKIDGTNIRVSWDGEKIRFGGRTERAQVPTLLLEMLMDTFTAERMRKSFEEGAEVTLFGEGYGPKIQKGGGNYRSTPGFRLFDVKVGDWWLERENVKDVANKLEILTVPEFPDPITELPTSAHGLAAIFDDSVVAQEDGGSGLQAEGIVARSIPTLFTRRGDRVMWKLKYRDFA